MSDEALRAQQRAGGEDPLAAVEGLYGRLRAGDLTRERLRLAAALDHAPAKAVLERLGEELPERARFALGLAAHGREVLLRAGLLLLEPHLADWQRAFPDDGAPRAAWSATRRWLEAAPAERPARVSEAIQAAELAERSSRYVHQHEEDTIWELFDRGENETAEMPLAWHGIASLAAALARATDEGDPEAVDELERACSACDEGEGIYDHESDDYIGHIESVELDFAAMERSLLPWVLDGRETLLEREARGERAALDEGQRALLAACEAEDWTERLAAGGVEPTLRAALTCAARAALHWDDPEDGRAWLALERVRAWVRSPASSREALEEAVEVSLDGAVEAMSAAQARGRASKRAAAFAEAAALTAELALDADDEARRASGLRAVFESASGAVPALKLRAALREDLAAWLETPEADPLGAGWQAP